MKKTRKAITILSISAVISLIPILSSAAASDTLPAVETTEAFSVSPSIMNAGAANSPLSDNDNREFQ